MLFPVFNADGTFTGSIQFDQLPESWIVETIRLGLYTIALVTTSQQQVRITNDNFALLVGPLSFSAGCVHTEFLTNDEEFLDGPWIDLETLEIKYDD